MSFWEKQKEAQIRLVVVRHVRYFLSWLLYVGIAALICGNLVIWGMWYFTKIKNAQLLRQIVGFQKQLAQRKQVDRGLAQCKAEGKEFMSRALLKSFLLKHINQTGISCRAIEPKNEKKRLRKNRLYAFNCRSSFSKLLELLKKPLPDPTITIHSLSVAKHQDNQVAFKIVYRAHAV